MLFAGLTLLSIFMELGACSDSEESDDDKVVQVEVNSQGLITTAKLSTFITNGQMLILSDGGPPGGATGGAAAVSFVPQGPVCFNVDADRTDNGAPGRSF